MNPEDFFRKRGAKPLKQLGQIFLRDRKAIRKVVQAAELQPRDTVVEIGPGLGALTRELAKESKRVIAIEKDPRMCEILKETLGGAKNVEIIKGDILRFEPKTYNLYPKPYKVVANLPFFLTAPVIRKFLETPNPPTEMVLVTQKELAQRICAGPTRLRPASGRDSSGQAKMNLLAVSVQFYAEPKIISYVPKKAFWPQPKVDSAILKITDILSASHQRRKSAFNQRFFKIVKAGFSHPRKQILNNFLRACPEFSEGLKLDKEQIKSWLLQNNISWTRRAETLTIQDWLNLTKTFKK